MRKRQRASRKEKLISRPRKKASKYYCSNPSIPLAPPLPLWIGGACRMRMVLNYKYPLIIFFLAVVTAGLLSVAAVLSALPKILIAVQPSLIETAEPARRLLDGRALLPGQTERKPLAIILENHVDARPVAGLEEASVVYETIVEGDITRFFALFDYDVDINRIGPVRSLRPFFIELAEEYNPVLFHAGGSADALEQIKNSLVYNINEISADGIYFWRDT